MAPSTSTESLGEGTGLTSAHGGAGLLSGGRARTHVGQQPAFMLVTLLVSEWRGGQQSLSCRVAWTSCSGLLSTDAKGLLPTLPSVGRP